MSDDRFSGWDRFSAPKKPPPAHGIKVKKPGTTWWGQQWIEALQNVLRGDAGRLARGRTYARAGRTHDLVVNDGAVHAKVTGSRPRPYDVTIALAQLDDAQWVAAIGAMAAKAAFSAELLAGQMPREIDEAFRAGGTSLFPSKRAELETDCTCPDFGDPCKHIAATHYVLGDALDRDPFLLFELRGRTRDQVLDALRSARSESVDEDVAAAIPTTSFVGLSDADYERPRAPLPAIALSFDTPVTHGAVIRQLGAPPAWSADRQPFEVLGTIVAHAAERARRIALREEEPEDRE